MAYVVRPIPSEASNFEVDFHKQFKYILSNIPSHPLPSNVLSKFNNIIMPRAYEQFIESIWNINVYEDDTWVITYPKCGTTWTQEAVWQICNDVDIEGIGSTPLRQRFPFVEIQAVGAVAHKENPFEFISEMKRPRFIKSHLPICFLPKQLWTVQPKIVYVAREPKDAAISFYHHYYNLYRYRGSKENFLDLFLSGLVEHGSYWDHIEQFHLLKPHYPNIMFVTYENMKHHMPRTLNELCVFLNKTLSGKQMEKLVSHLQFENMKENPGINPSHLKETVQRHRPGSEYTFIRRGITDSHKDEMPKEYIEKFNEMTKGRFHELGLYH
ncbi:Luciferin sulfotransferase [Pseudolycoriella hygida]|uniref:Luciferin sulfotransferase n=1 Tax=Pseudolycoriella hygida TaxID=35572 RepID=A0A9Q0NDP4_9DIPT|nr:Luciferin sulfotransferase [Pseudolycoriella hygida]